MKQTFLFSKGLKKHENFPVQLKFLEQLGNNFEIIRLNIPIVRDVILGLLHNDNSQTIKKCITLS